MKTLRALLLLLFTAACFQGFALDSKPIVLNPTTGNFRNIPTGDRLTLPDATGDLVTIDVGVQAAARTISLPTLAGADTFAMLGVANTFTLTNAFAAITATNITNSALTSGRVPYASTGGLFADSAKLLYNDTLPTLTLGAGASNSPFLVMNKGNTGGQVCYIKFQAQGNDNIIIRSSGNNTGSDAGGNFGIDAYTDASAFIDTPFSFNRIAAGTVTLGSAARVVNLPGTTSASSSTVGAVTVGNGVAATNVAIGGGNVNAGAIIRASAASGAARLQVDSVDESSTIASNSAYFLGGVGIAKSLSLGNDASGTAIHWTANTAYRCRTSVSTDKMYIDVPQIIFRDQSNGFAGQATLANGLFTLHNATGTTLTVSSTTDSTSTTTGSVTTLGGIGASKQISARNYLATGGTITVSQPVFNATQTWNDGAVQFVGIKLDITNTASTSGSFLMHLLTGGSSRFSVAPEGLVSAIAVTATTNTSDNLLSIANNSTGTPAANYGALFQVYLKSSTTVSQSALQINTVWVDATHATRKARTTFSIGDSGATREAMRIEASGTASMIGFLGASAVARPSTTGETVGFTAGGGTAVTDASTFTGNVGATAYRISDIVKHLKNLGLIAQ